MLVQTNRDCQLYFFSKKSPPGHKIIYGGGGITYLDNIASTSHIIPADLNKSYRNFFGTHYNYIDLYYHPAPQSQFVKNKFRGLHPYNQTPLKPYRINLKQPLHHYQTHHIRTRRVPNRHSAILPHT